MFIGLLSDPRGPFNRENEADARRGSTKLGIVLRHHCAAANAIALPYRGQAWRFRIRHATMRVSSFELFPAQASLGGEWAGCDETG
jgi:hypothetical protein